MCNFRANRRLPPQLLSRHSERVTRSCPPSRRPRRSPHHNRAHGLGTQEGVLFGGCRAIAAVRDYVGVDLVRMRGRGMCQRCTSSCCGRGCCSGCGWKSGSDTRISHLSQGRITLASPKEVRDEEVAVAVCCPETTMSIAVAHVPRSGS